MRLFLLSDIQRVAQPKLSKLQKTHFMLERRKLQQEQKLAEVQVNVSWFS